MFSNIICLIIVTMSVCGDAKRSSFFHSVDNNGGEIIQQQEQHSTTSSSPPASIVSSVEDVNDDDDVEEPEKKCVNLFLGYVNIRGLCEREEYQREQRTVCSTNSPMSGGRTLKFKLFTSCVVGESCTFLRRRPIAERGRCVSIQSNLRRACLSLHVVDPMSDQC